MLTGTGQTMVSGSLADGDKAATFNMAHREYHHLFPDSYLQKNNRPYEQDKIFRALNCALVTWVTNRKISAKPPLTYLQERIDKSSLGEEVVRHRLELRSDPVGRVRPPLDQMSRTRIATSFGLVPRWSRRMPTNLYGPGTER